MKEDFSILCTAWLINTRVSFLPGFLNVKCYWDVRKRACIISLIIFRWFVKTIEKPLFDSTLINLYVNTRQKRLNRNKKGRVLETKIKKWIYSLIMSCIHPPCHWNSITLFSLEQILPRKNINRAHETAKPLHHLYSATSTLTTTNSFCISLIIIISINLNVCSI